MSSSDREIEPLSDSDILEMHEAPDSSPDPGESDGMDLDYDNVGSTMIVATEELESDVLELDYEDDAPTRAAMEPPPRPSLYGSFVAMESERTPAYLVVDEVLATLGSKVRSPIPPAARPSSSALWPSEVSGAELPRVSVETPRVSIPVAATSSTHAVGDETTPVSVYESIAPVALSESLVPPSNISSSYPANQNSTLVWAATFAALGTAAAALVILLLSHDGTTAVKRVPMEAPRANAVAPFVAPVTPEELPAAQPNVLSFPESEAVMIAAETRVTASAPVPAEIPPAPAAASAAPAGLAPATSAISVSTQVIGKPSAPAAPPVRLDPPLTLSGPAPTPSPSPAPVVQTPKRAKTPMEILADEQLRR